eukprot:scaffold54436_cov72-Phaeocystis_antarctica.AAC.3
MSKYRGFKVSVRVKSGTGHLLPVASYSFQDLDRPRGQGASKPSLHMRGALMLEEAAQVGRARRGLLALLYLGALLFLGVARYAERLEVL